MPEIDRWALHQLEILKERVLKAYDEMEFHVIYQAVNAFCTVEMSAFYLDILKDRLYTSRRDSLERRSAQTAFYRILDALVDWWRRSSPSLPTRSGGTCRGRREESVHLAEFPALTPEVKDDALAERWVRHHHGPGRGLQGPGTGPCPEDHRPLPGCRRRHQPRRRKTAPSSGSTPRS